jgi:diguanylate cyclase (GGDEF)-like protein
MNDPRLVEIAFLSALDRERSASVAHWDWDKRLGVSKEVFRDMVFDLFRAGCLDATSTIPLPSEGLTTVGPPGEALGSWGAYDLQRNVRAVLRNESFAAYVNHAGRLRLWRLQDEVFKGRFKDAFGLLWDKRHWATDLIVRLAMKAPDETAAVMFIDVDDFKSVNEKAGHTVGDDVLRLIFQVVVDLAVVGGGDAYRWGGDEVTVFLHGLDLDACAGIGEAIRQEVERQCSLHAELTKAGVKTTVSIGVGAFTSRPRPVELTARVAALMKTVKAAGKNNVVAKTLTFS